MNSIEKFLDFNGRKVYFLAADGQWWIAIKPICEALGVDYSRQLRTLKADPILGQLWSLETIVAGDGKQRKMVCLPEKYIYGWLFSIQSESPALQEYRGKCYELLYNYFHGSITDRNKYLMERTTCRAEVKKLRRELDANPDWRRLTELEGLIRNARKELKRLDHEQVASQLPLWNVAGNATN